MNKLLKRKYCFVVLLLTILVFSESGPVYAIPLYIEKGFDTTRTNYNSISMDSNKTYGIVTNKFSNMHDSPSFLSNQILKLSYGDFVEVLDRDNTWCKVKYFYKVGYISTATIEIFSDAEKYSSPDSQKVGKVTTNALNVRNFPTSNESTVIGSLEKSTYVDILTKVGDWYQVKFNNLVAFVSSDYLDIIDNLKTGRIDDIDYSQMFTELIETYTITHSSNSNRDHNLEVASQIINGDTSGYILYPNSQFNWFYIIGDTTPEKGFLEAGIIENKVSALGYGGGCCEVASTINSAIMELGIPTNAHTHSVQPKYLIGHHEATVSFDSGINFTFTNTLDYSIKIEVTTDKGNVTVNVYKIPV